MITHLLANSDFQNAGYGYNPTGSASGGGIFVILVIIGLWVTFDKAGLRGWAAIVPFYNTYTLVRLSGRNGWWFLLFFIPIVNIVYGIMVALRVARVFDRSGAFGFFLLFLLPFIGYLMLGFGRSRPVGNTFVTYGR